jgi:hypothetical protein
MCGLPSVHGDEEGTQQGGLPAHGGQEQCQVVAICRWPGLQRFCALDLTDPVSPERLQFFPAAILCPFRTGSPHVPGQALPGVFVPRDHP